MKTTRMYVRRLRRFSNFPTTLTFGLNVYKFSWKRIKKKGKV